MNKFVVTAVLVAGVGCGDTKDATPTGAVAAWQQAGLTPTEFKAGDPKFDAKSCTAGKVSGLYVTLCEFDKPDAAEGARAKGLESVGAATGLSLARENTLMVVVDRDKVDPSGRALNKVAKLFWALEGTPDKSLSEVLGGSGSDDSK